MFLCLLVNVFSSKYLDLFNKVCLYWTSSSAVIIMVTLLFMADTRNSAEYVFTHYDASRSGWPAGWAFFVGLLQASYTLTGYGMVCLGLPYAYIKLLKLI
jgi:amino acid transporter